MKETYMSDKQIIKDLKKNGRVKIECICESCTKGLFSKLLQEFHSNEKEYCMIDLGCIEIGKGMYALDIDLVRAKWGDE